jgi:DNA-binding beta-propeller fold protein YncE
LLLMGWRIRSIVAVLATALGAMVFPSLSYADILAIGSGPGTAPGSFDRVWNVALSPSGSIYATDFNNCRVQQFTAGGSFVRQWGTCGSGDGQFSGPRGIAVHPGSGEVYVADLGNGRIQRFSATGTYLSQWGRPPASPGDVGGLNPQDVAVEASGNVLVANNNPPIDRIVRFSPTGAIIEQFPVAGSPVGLGTRPDGGFLVANGGGLQNETIEIRSASGAITGSFGSAGSGPGQFTGLSDAAVDPNRGDIYAVDLNNDRVQKFSSSGEFLAQLGAAGTQLGQFDTTIGIAADAANHIFVADTNNHRIQRIDMSDVEPQGPLGVSINAGATYTNDPAVELTLSVPAWATQMFVSNDGGFVGASPIGPSEVLNWTLSSSGPERLPKTVYVQFASASQTSATYTDDIILDETEPKLKSVAVLDSGDGGKAAKRAPSYKLKIKAKDKTSGVEAMQITSKKSKAGKWKQFKKKPKFRSASGKIFVRVRDGASNRSKWKRAEG